MPTVEILDGPPEWAGVVYETDEDMVADEIGLTHPRWRGTPVRVERGALYAYRKVEVVGDRHRYRYQGPWHAEEDLAGWDVLVVQEGLESGDPLQLWGRPVRVYAAPPGTARPDPARPVEEQGWQELKAGCLRRRQPGTGSYLQQGLAQRMSEGDPWATEHWQRLAGKHGQAKDAEAELIHDDIRRMLYLARAAMKLRRLRPDAVVTWTSDPPFPATTTYIPVIGNELAALPGMGYPEWVARQDRALLIVHPAFPEEPAEPALGSARVYHAPAGAPVPDPSVVLERQGWMELAATDWRIGWLLHIRTVDI